MNANLERNTNIAAIVALALVAMVTSPRPIAQMAVFIALITVVFGRDFFLRRLTRSKL